MLRLNSIFLIPIFMQPVGLVFDLVEFIISNIKGLEKLVAEI